MKPSIYRVTANIPGALFVMPKPSSEWLEDDIGAYRSAGIDKIVSLLTTEEIYDLGLQRERACCEAQRIDYTQFSINDRGLPDHETFSELVTEIRDGLRSDRNVGIHCRAGIGRSGMLASCVLVSLGLKGNQAVATVSRARGVSIPDTEEQLQFILNFT